MSSCVVSYEYVSNACAYGYPIVTFWGVSSGTYVKNKGNHSRFSFILLYVVTRDKCRSARLFIVYFIVRSFQNVIFPAQLL